MCVQATCLDFVMFFIANKRDDVFRPHKRLEGISKIPTFPTRLSPC